MLWKHWSYFDSHLKSYWINHRTISLVVFHSNCSECSWCFQISTLCQEHKTNVDPLLSSPIKYFLISSSSYDESVSTRFLEFKKKERKNKKKRRQGGKQPTIASHVGGEQLTARSHAGGKRPTTTSHARGTNIVDNPKRIGCEPKLPCQFLQGRSPYSYVLETPKGTKSVALVSRIFYS